MSKLSYTDIIADECYNKGVKQGIKQSNKKYTRLLNAVKEWMQIYESSFGEPEECKEYFNLKKLIK